MRGVWDRTRNGKLQVERAVHATTPCPASINS